MANEETEGPGVLTGLARAAGSIWLISLCFIFVAMAVAAYGFRLYYKDALGDESGARRIELAQEVVRYNETLNALIEEVRGDRYYVPDARRYAPPTLQRNIDDLVRENDNLRRRPPPPTPGTPGTGSRRRGPTPEPSDTNPG